METETKPSKSELFARIEAGKAARVRAAQLRGDAAEARQSLQQAVAAAEADIAAIEVEAYRAENAALDATGAELELVQHYAPRSAEENEIASQSCALNQRLVDFRHANKFPETMSEPSDTELRAAESVLESVEAEARRLERLRADPRAIGRARLVVQRAATERDAARTKLATEQNRFQLWSRVIRPLIAQRDALKARAEQLRAEAIARAWEPDPE